jgi:hypothetical protein
MRKLCLLAVLVVGLVPASATAQITGITFSGPGGTVADGGTSGNLTEPILTYTAVDSAGSYNINEAPLFGIIHNSTGQAWSGFQLVNLTPSLGSFDNSWSYYTSPFTSLLNTTTLVVASGGAGVPDGTGMSMFGNYVTTGPGTLVLRETPIAVPEPATITLLSSALLLIGGIQLFRRRKAA